MHFSRFVSNYFNLGFPKNMFFRSMYFKHLPALLKPLGKDLTFNLPNDQNEIYLTFDDGPHPTITPWVLEELAKVEAKATFFLIGKNAEEHPDVVARIIEEGHSIGNHTYEHKSGWKTDDSDYLADVERCSKLVHSKLFRPPYGQISRSQAKTLKDQYRLIQWSDLSADFDPQYSADECFHFVSKKIESGSIVVFHDSPKAWPRLEALLPKCLEFYAHKGFKMKPILG
jgi:peptidoglycan-N-acetylglucosamine deacetylase